MARNTSSSKVKVKRKSKRSKKKKVSGKRRQRKKKPQKRVWLRRLGMLAALTAVCLGAYTFYLDYRVTRTFEGGRWDVPAHVYARPLELYAGLQISALELKHELTRLGYQRDSKADLPGTFAVGRDSIILTTREFQFFDGKQDAKSLRIAFARDEILSIRNRADDYAEALVRLDPLLIGSLFPGGGEDRVLLSPDQIPDLLVRALIAVEDRSFFDHMGVDPKGIARAFFANLAAGEIKQGGSTLTQQLVKSYYLDGRRTLGRKFNEAIMAMLLEFRYEKEELLNAYVNEIFLGQDGARAIHGFGLASHFYFNKPLWELRGDEIALLVGLVKGPSFYDPQRHPIRAKERRSIVLAQMLEQEVATEDQIAQWQDTPITLANDTQQSSYFPAYMSLVRQQLRREYDDQDLTRAGLRIFTSFDPVIQRKAEKALTDFLSSREDDGLNGAVVVTTVDGAEVLAVVGGRRTGFDGFNRAVNARRPIGSLVKPAVYLAAFESSDYHLLSIINDEPITVELDRNRSWSPENYDDAYVGDVTLLRSLAESRNVPTVRLGLSVGIEIVINALKRMGVNQDIDAYPSLLLGTLELSPVEVAQMYNTLANGGFLTPQKGVRFVTDSEGSPLGRYPLKIKRTLQSDSLHQVVQGLVAVVHRGTAKSVGNSFPSETTVAGKTGTTDDLRDSWFAGFSGNYLSVVWLGHDDNKSTGLTGASGALKVWTGLMGGLSNQGLLLDAPDGFEPAWVDYPSGLMSREDCGDAWPVSLPDHVDVARHPQCDRGGRFGKRALRWLHKVFGG